MKKFFFFAALILSTATLFSQNEGMGKQKQDSEEWRLKNLRIKMDSQQRVSDSFWNNQQKAVDSLQMAIATRQMGNNLDGFMYEQRAREKKARLAIWIRIGFGLGLLALGIFGLMRKRKK